MTDRNIECYTKEELLDIIKNILSSNSKKGTLEILLNDIEHDAKMMVSFAVYGYEILEALKDSKTAILS